MRVNCLSLHAPSRFTLGIVQRQSLQTSLIAYAGAAFGYLNFVLLYPRFMAPEQVGLIRVLISLAVLLSQFSLLGSSYTLQRYFPHFNNPAEKHFGFLSYAMRNALVGFGVFALLTWLAKPWINDVFESRSPLLNDYYEHMYPLALMLMVFEVLFFYARSLLLTVVPVFIKELLLRMMQTALVAAFALTHMDFNLFLWLFAGTYLLHFIAILIYLSWKGRLYLFEKIRVRDVMSTKQLNRYSGFIYLASISAIFVSNIDVVLLGAQAGLDDAAVYAVALFIGTIVIIPSRSMNQVVLPLVADAWKQNDTARIDKLYKQTANNQLIVGGFMVVMVLFNTKWVLSLLPPIYANAEWVVYVIALGRLLDMAAGINGEIILVSKHVRFNLATNLFLMVLAAFSTYWFIVWFDILGAAMAISLSYFTYNAIRLVFLYRKYKMQPFVPTSLIVWLVLIISGAFALILPDSYKAFIPAVLISGLVGLLYWGLVLRLRLSAELTELAERWGRGKIF